MRHFRLPTLLNNQLITAHPGIPVVTPWRDPPPPATLISLQPIPAFRYSHQARSAFRHPHLHVITSKFQSALQSIWPVEIRLPASLYHCRQSRHSQLLSRRCPAFLILAANADIPVVPQEVIRLPASRNRHSHEPMPTFTYFVTPLERAASRRPQHQCQYFKS